MMDLEGLFLLADLGVVLVVFLFQLSWLIWKIVPLTCRMFVVLFP